MNSIYKKISKLDNELREAVAEFRQKFLEIQKEEREALQKECGEIGHKWRDDGYNINYTVKFYKCMNCKLAKSEDLD